MIKKLFALILAFTLISGSLPGSALAQNLPSEKAQIIDRLISHFEISNTGFQYTKLLKKSNISQHNYKVGIPAQMRYFHNGGETHYPGICGLYPAPYSLGVSDAISDIRALAQIGTPRDIERILGPLGSNPYVHEAVYTESLIVIASTPAIDPDLKAAAISELNYLKNYRTAIVYGMNKEQDAALRQRIAVALGPNLKEKFDSVKMANKAHNNQIKDKIGTYAGYAFMAGMIYSGVKMAATPYRAPMSVSSYKPVEPAPLKISGKISGGASPKVPVEFGVYKTAPNYTLTPKTAPLRIETPSSTPGKIIRLSPTGSARPQVSAGFDGNAALKLNTATLTQTRPMIRLRLQRHVEQRQAQQLLDMTNKTLNAKFKMQTMRVIRPQVNPAPTVSAPAKPTFTPPVMQLIPNPKGSPNIDSRTNMYIGDPLIGTRRLMGERLKEAIKRGYQPTEEELASLSRTDAYDLRRFIRRESTKPTTGVGSFTASSVKTADVNTAANANVQDAAPKSTKLQEELAEIKKEQPKSQASVSLYDIALEPMAGDDTNYWIDPVTHLNRFQNMLPELKTNAPAKFYDKPEDQELYYLALQIKNLMQRAKDKESNRAIASRGKTNVAYKYDKTYDALSRLLAETVVELPMPPKYYTKKESVLSTLQTSFENPEAVTTAILYNNITPEKYKNTNIDPKKLKAPLKDVLKDFHTWSEFELALYFNYHFTRVLETHFPGKYFPPSLSFNKHIKSIAEVYDRDNHIVINPQKVSFAGSSNIDPAKLFESATHEFNHIVTNIILKEMDPSNDLHFIFTEYHRGFDQSNSSWEKYMDKNNNQMDYDLFYRILPYEKDARYAGSKFYDLVKFYAPAQPNRPGNIWPSGQKSAGAYKNFFEEIEAEKGISRQFSEKKEIPSKNAQENYNLETVEANMPQSLFRLINQGSGSSYGTGFFVDYNGKVYAVTKEAMLSVDPGAFVRITFKHTDGEIKNYDAKIHSISAQGDVALLEISPNLIPFVRPLKLAHTKPAVGENGVSFGFPDGKYTKTNDGAIIQSGPMAITKNNFTLNPEGSCGSPLLDSYGYVIGIHTSSCYGATPESRAIGVDFINELLQNGPNFNKPITYNGKVIGHINNKESIHVVKIQDLKTGQSRTEMFKRSMLHDFDLAGALKVKPDQLVEITIHALETVDRTIKYQTPAQDAYSLSTVEENIEQSLFKMGWNEGYATGFIIENAQTGKLFGVTTNDNIKRKGEIPISYKNANGKWTNTTAKLLLSSPHGNTALLELPQEMKASAKPLKLTQQRVQEGDITVSFGYTDAMFNKHDNRKVAKVGPVIKTTYNFTVPDTEGACGSPLLNQDGFVVGVHCGSDLNKTISYAANIGHLYNVIQAQSFNNSLKFPLKYNGIEVGKINIDETLLRIHLFKNGAQKPQTPILLTKKITNQFNLEDFMPLSDNDYIELTIQGPNGEMRSIFYNASGPIAPPAVQPNKTMAAARKDQIKFSMLPQSEFIKQAEQVLKDVEAFFSANNVLPPHKPGTSGLYNKWNETKKNKDILPPAQQEKLENILAANEKIKQQEQIKKNQTYFDAFTQHVKEKGYRPPVEGPLGASVRGIALGHIVTATPEQRIFAQQLMDAAPTRAEYEGRLSAQKAAKELWAFGYKNHYAPAGGAKASAEEKRIVSKITNIRTGADKGATQEELDDIEQFFKIFPTKQEYNSALIIADLFEEVRAFGNKYERMPCSNPISAEYPLYMKILSGIAGRYVGMTPARQKEFVALVESIKQKELENEKARPGKIIEGYKKFIAQSKRAPSQAVPAEEELYAESNRLKNGYIPHSTPEHIKEITSLINSVPTRKVINWELNIQETVTELGEFARHYNRAPSDKFEYEAALLSRANLLVSGKIKNATPEQTQIATEIMSSLPAAPAPEKSDYTPLKKKNATLQKYTLELRELRDWAEDAMQNGVMSKEEKLNALKRAKSQLHDFDKRATAPANRKDLDQYFYQDIKDLLRYIHESTMILEGHAVAPAPIQKQPANVRTAAPAQPQANYAPLEKKNLVLQNHTFELGELRSEAEAIVQNSVLSPQEKIAALKRAQSKLANFDKKATAPKYRGDLNQDFYQDIKKLFRYIYENIKGLEGQPGAPNKTMAAAANNKDLKFSVVPQSKIIEMAESVLKDVEAFFALNNQLPVNGSSATPLYRKWLEVKKNKDILPQNQQSRIETALNANEAAWAKKRQKEMQESIDSFAAYVAQNGHRPIANDPRHEIVEKVVNGKMTYATPEQVAQCKELLSADTYEQHQNRQAVRQYIKDLWAFGMKHQHAPSKHSKNRDEHILAGRIYTIRAGVTNVANEEEKENIERFYSIFPDKERLGYANAINSLFNETRVFFAKNVRMPSPAIPSERAFYYRIQYALNGQFKEMTKAERQEFAALINSIKETEETNLKNYPDDVISRYEAFAAKHKRAPSFTIAAETELYQDANRIRNNNMPYVTPAHIAKITTLIDATPTLSRGVNAENINETITELEEFLRRYSRTPVKKFTQERLLLQRAQNIATGRLKTATDTQIKKTAGLLASYKNSPAKTPEKSDYTPLKNQNSVLQKTTIEFRALRDKSEGLISNVVISPEEKLSALKRARFELADFDKRATAKDNRKHLDAYFYQDMKTLLRSISTEIQNLEAAPSTPAQSQTAQDPVRYSSAQVKNTKVFYVNPFTKPANPQPQPAQEPYNLAWVENNIKQALFKVQHFGVFASTGFVVEGEHEGKKGVYGIIPHHIILDNGKKQGITYYSNEEEKLGSANILASGNAQYIDFTILKLPKAFEKISKALRFDPAPPAPGEILNSYGFLHNDGKFVQFNDRRTKFVTPFHTIAHYNFKDEKPGGFCGSPIINDKGYVIGMHCGSTKDLNETYSVNSAFIPDMIKAANNKGIATRPIIFNGKKIGDINVNEYIYRIQVRKANSVKEYGFRYSVVDNKLNYSQIQDITGPLQAGETLTVFIARPARSIDDLNDYELHYTEQP